MSIKGYLNLICRDPIKKKGRYVYLENNVKRGIIDIDNLLVMVSFLNLKSFNLKYHFAKHKSSLKIFFFKSSLTFSFECKCLTFFKSKEKFLEKLDLL